MQYEGGSHTVVRGFGVMVRVAVLVDVTVIDPVFETTTFVSVRVMGIVARSGFSEYLVRAQNALYREIFTQGDCTRLRKTATTTSST